MTSSLELKQDDEGWSFTVTRPGEGKLFGNRMLSMYGLVGDVFDLKVKFSLLSLFSADPLKTMQLLEVYHSCMMRNARMWNKIFQQNLDAFDRLISEARLTPDGSTLWVRLAEMKEEYQGLGFPIQ